MILHTVFMMLVDLRIGWKNISRQHGKKGHLSTNIVKGTAFQKANTLMHINEHRWVSHSQHLS